MQNTPKIRGYIPTKNYNAVLLYRRSNKLTYVFQLSTKKGAEKLQKGAHFYGKIYPDRCGVSPCGKYFVYFAMGKNQKRYKEKYYCWTAVSHPPKLTAKIIFGHSDTWGGGGRFLDENTLCITSGLYPDFDISESKMVDQYKIIFKPSLDRNNIGNDWVEINAGKTLQEKNKSPSWRKTVGKISIVRNHEIKSFVKTENGQEKGEYDSHSYKFIHPKTKEETPIENKGIPCLWADFDNNGRLITAIGSKVSFFSSINQLVRNAPSKEFDLEKFVE